MSSGRLSWRFNEGDRDTEDAGSDSLVDGCHLGQTTEGALDLLE